MRAVFILLAGLVCATSGQAATSEARLAEAQAIFAVELAGEKALAPCRVDGEAWKDYPVPADLAQKYLGLAAQEDVAPAPPTASPIVTLDPGGARSEIFCSKPEWRDRRAAAIAGIRPGETITHIALGYTFPLFDAAMRTAIVIVERDVHRSRRADDGSGPQSSGETFGIVHVYEKHGGRWDLVIAEEIYSALY
jgi:hypothetical protein